MNYGRRDAKDYAREHFKGIWAAALTPFAPNLALDEAGLRRNLRHWVDDLGIDGVFVCGKQGEFFSMSVAERKRSFDIAVEELGGHRTILSCSDQNLDTVIDLAKHAQAIGADNILVSTASEEEWFDNIVELGWRLYLCSSPPYLLQTKADRRMREYTDLAFHGEIARAKAVRDSLDPVRAALRRTRPTEKFHAHSKCWQELLGQT